MAVSRVRRQSMLDSGLVVFLVLQPWLFWLVQPQKAALPYDVYLDGARGE
ncbi:hypothetical protein O9992_22780 [Vibrio lentus]|nr:hypothetical protein [Vibrio lentus]